MEIGQFLDLGVTGVLAWVIYRQSAQLQALQDRIMTALERELGEE